MAPGGSPLGPGASPLVPGGSPLGPGGFVLPGSLQQQSYLDQLASLKES